MKTINTFSKAGYTVNLVRYNKPVMGGHYAVELSFNDNDINSKDGLCLDAALEVFNKTSLEINKKFNQSIN